VRLLQAGEMVLVYPGGADDSFKTRAEAHTLKWGIMRDLRELRYAPGVPIVPVAATGIDEIYHVVAREPWIGRRLFGSPRYDLPLPAVSSRAGPDSCTTCCLPWTHRETLLSRRRSSGCVGPHTTASTRFCESTARASGGNSQFTLVLQPNSITR